MAAAWTQPQSRPGPARRPPKMFAPGMSPSTQRALPAPATSESTTNLTNRRAPSRLACYRDQPYTGFLTHSAAHGPVRCNASSWWGD